MLSCLYYTPIVQNLLSKTKKAAQTLKVRAAFTHQRCLETP